MAVSTGAVALPFWSVIIGIAGVEAKVPLAPGPPVTLNVTATPGNGMPFVSVMLTARDVAKACPTAVLWPSPAAFVMAAGASPACVTVTSGPSTVMCPVRLRGEILAAKEKLSDPPATPVTLSHAWSLDADNSVVAGSTCTVTASAPPAALSLRTAAPKAR